MVKFAPKYNEVIVSSLSRQEVMKRLQLVTDRTNYLDTAALRDRQQYVFNGIVRDQCFHLSLKIDKADSFLPLVKGEIESTRKGSILFLEYSLFPSTIFFLSFWAVITFFLTLFFLTFKQEWHFAMLSASIGVGNYLFSCLHFKRKVKQSQRVFYNILNLQTKNRPR